MKLYGKLVITFISGLILGLGIVMILPSENIDMQIAEAVAPLDLPKANTVKISIPIQEMTEEELKLVEKEIATNRMKAEKNINKVKEQQKAIALAELTKKNPTPASINIEKGNYASKYTVPTDSNKKTYMDYRKITNKNSKQYKLQQLEGVYTDENGYRRLNDYYMIALGTYYADGAGYVFNVTLDTGKQFSAIVGDIKSNAHTDSTHRQHKIDESVLEFIVDVSKINPTAKRAGNMASCPVSNMGGNISKIEKIGKLQ